LWQHSLPIPVVPFEQEANFNLPGSDDFRLVCHILLRPFWRLFVRAAMMRDGPPLPVSAPLPAPSVR